MGRRVPPILFSQLVLLAMLQSAHMYVIIPNVRLMVQEFGVGYTYAGILLGAYMFLSGIAALVWSIYSDVRGMQRKLLIFGGFVVGGILTVLCSKVANPYIFGALYVLAGMSLSVIAPFSVTIIIDIFRSEERAEKLMLFRILSGFGCALGFGIGVLMGAEYGGWRKAIGLLGMSISLIGAPIAALMWEPPKGFSERKLHDVLLAVKRYPFTLRPKDIRTIAGTRSNIYITMQGIFGIIACGVIEVWVVQYLVVEAGASEMAASMFLGIGAVGALGGILIARLSDVLYVRKPSARPMIAAVCSFVEGVFFILFLLTPIRLDVSGSPYEILIGILYLIKHSRAVMAAVLFFFIAMLFNSSVGSIRNSIISDVNLPEYRATVISGVNIVELFAKSIGVAAVGVLIDVMGSIRIPLILAMGFWFLSGYYWIRVSMHVERDLWKLEMVLDRRREALRSMG